MKRTGFCCFVLKQDGSRMRPVMHVSLPKEEFTDKVNVPDMDDLLKKHKRRELYAHSDLIDNETFTEYLATEFREVFDFQVEAKLKSVASALLQRRLLQYEQLAIAA